MSAGVKPGRFSRRRTDQNGPGPDLVPDDVESTLHDACLHLIIMPTLAHSVSHRRQPSADWSSRPTNLAKGAGPVSERRAERVAPAIVGSVRPLRLHACYASGDSGRGLVTAAHLLVMFQERRPSTSSGLLAWACGSGPDNGGTPVLRRCGDARLQWRKRFDANTGQQASPVSRHARRQFAQSIRTDTAGSRARDAVGCRHLLGLPRSRLCTWISIARRERVTRKRAHRPRRHCFASRHRNRSH
jgi:hypothetical protein